MTYSTFAPKETEAPASQSRSASKPAANVLRIDGPHDAYEQEAGRVAAGVMSGRPMPSWSISNMKLRTAQGQPTGAGSLDEPAPRPNNHDEAADKPLIPAYRGLKDSPVTGLQLSTFEPLFKPKPIHVLDQQYQLQLLTPSHVPSEAVKKEEPTPVQRRADCGATTAGEVPASIRNVIHSPGLPLEAGTQQLMESKFEADFSDVRVHTDSKAADSAKALNARAYTFGGDITFAAGEYSPETTQGRKLLVHELTHVVQQSGSARSSAQHASLEHEAECAAQEPSKDRKSHIAKASSGIGIACAPSGGDARQVAQALVKQMQAANKPVVVNIGGTGASHEPPDAINVNPNIVAPRKDIPNLVQTKGEEIGTLFEAGQVSKVVGNRLSPQVFDWERVASGGHAILQDGGTIEINFRWAHEEAAASLVRALTNAGFKDVKNISNVVIIAVKGSGNAPLGSGGVVPGTGTAITPSTGTGGSALKAAVAESEPTPIPNIKGSTNLSAEVAGAATEVEGVGVAARVAGIALETAAGLIIGIAVGLFLDWLKGLIEEAALKRDLEALSPQIQTKLLTLMPKITQLQQEGGKVYSRVTVDVTRKSGAMMHSEGGFIAAATWDNYEGVALLGVDVAGDAAPSAHSERNERLSPNESRVHSVEAFSTLIDDQPRRLREKRMAEIVEKHRVKQTAVPPPPTAPSSPPLLPSLAPQHTPPEFNPLPGAPGPSPFQEIDKNVEAGRNRCLKLIADGNRLQSSSASNDDIKKFFKAEADWRDIVTYWLLYYKNNGPDYGRSKCDELLNSDQYGGKLKQIRQTFGG